MACATRTPSPPFIATTHPQHPTQGFSLNENKKCVACKTGCLECADGANGINTCLRCKQGLYPNPANDGECIAPAVANCLQVSETSAGECAVCAEGFSMSADKKTCTACKSGCLECADGANGINTCLRCKQGLYPNPANSGECIAPTVANCLEVSETNAEKCVVCPPRFSMSIDQTKCTECKNGCAQCASIGIGSDGINDCLRCRQGLYPDIRNPGDCILPAVPNCLQVSENDAGTCAVCAPRFAQTVSDIQCLACGANCAVCVAGPAPGTTTCTACDLGTQPDYQAATGGSVSSCRSVALLQCGVPVVGTNYQLISAAPVPQPPSPVIQPPPKLALAPFNLTGEEFLRSIGFNESSVGTPAMAVIHSDVESGKDICSNDVAYAQGPLNAPTVCQLWTRFRIPANPGAGRPTAIGWPLDNAAGKTMFKTCSGSFIPDPAGTGRLLFLTAAHCVTTTRMGQAPPEGLNDRTANGIALNFAQSFVVCDRPDSRPPARTGVFRPVGVAISRINFEQGFGLKDGAVLQLQPFFNTNPLFATPVSVAAITGVQGRTVSNLLAGFPGVDTRWPGCTAAALGDTHRLHFSRATSTLTLDTNVNSVTFGTINTRGLSSCGGNSGGPLMDESACVQYAILSASNACDGTNSNNNIFARITNGDNFAGGVDVPALTTAVGPGIRRILP